MVSLSNHELGVALRQAQGERKRVNKVTTAISSTAAIRLLLLLGVVVSAACGDVSGGVTPAATATPLAPLQTSAPVAPVGNANPVVTVGGASFKVELAITQDQRIQGLSGRAGLAPGAGMLFVFDEEGRYSFWMKEMRFPLDLVWIGPSPLRGEGCTVVDITPNAPPPAPGLSVTELPLYTPVAPARYVLEVNGGETEAVGIHVGDRVEFSGPFVEGAGLYGC